MRIAGYSAFGAALVYVALKALWVAGSTVGVVGVTPTGWVASNAGTGLLGVIGAVVALATVRPWGMRIPVWLLAVPMWVGAGLLAPFVILMPAAAVLAPPDSDLLEPWVFVVVYGSFIVLGVGLTVALPLYARARLGSVVRGSVVRGSVGPVPPGATHPAQVALAWPAAVAAVGVAVVRLSWVFGATVGLSSGTRGAWLRLGDAVTAAQALAAALGILVLVHRRGPFGVPMVATWLGAGGMVGAGFLGMATILSGDRWTPTGQTFPTHATTTFLTACAGAAISVVALMLLLERSVVLGR